MRDQEITLRANRDQQIIVIMLDVESIEIIINIIQKYHRHLIENDPLLSQISHDYDIHLGGQRYEIEGEELIIPKKKGSTLFEIKFEDIANFNLEKLAVQLFESGNDHIKRLHKMIFEDISTVSELTGNKKSIDFNEVSFDDFNDLLEDMAIRFDSDGEPILPQLYIDPDSFEKLKNLEPTKEELERREKIINKKREEYFAQKCNRRLSYIN